MDKTTLERYLKIYPRIGNEISRLELEISDLEEKKEKYCGFNSVEHIKSLIETIDVALESCKGDLMEAYVAKAKIINGLSQIDETEKKIIELRFWSAMRDMKWNDIASELNYHKKSVEKIYRETIKKMLLS